MYFRFYVGNMSCEYVFIYMYLSQHIHIQKIRTMKTIFHKVFSFPVVVFKSLYSTSYNMISTNFSFIIENVTRNNLPSRQLPTQS